MYSNKTLSDYLKQKQPKLSLLNKLKVVYRPYICPLADVIDVCNNVKSVFDIGCGSGQLLLLLNKFSNVNKLAGIEISEELIHNASNLLIGKKDVNLSVFDGDFIPDSINEYDVVTLIDVLHHVPASKQFDFMKQIHDKMKTGAMLVFKDIDASTPWVYANKTHDLLLGGEAGNEIKYKFAAIMLTEIGFSFKNTFKKRMFWYDHFFIICIKN